MVGAEFGDFFGAGPHDAAAREVGAEGEEEGFGAAVVEDFHEDADDVVEAVDGVVVAG